MPTMSLVWPMDQRNQRRILALIAYSLTAGVSYVLAYFLALGSAWFQEWGSTFLATLPLLVAIRIVCDLAFRLSTGRWRYVSTHDVVRLAGATTVGSLVFYLTTLAVPFIRVVPLPVIAIDWVLSGYLTAGAWITYRVGFEQLRHYRSGFNGNAKRVLIVGAGEAGSMLAREMRRFPTGYRTIGFIDDDPRKWGSSLHGIHVLGSTDELPQIAKQVRAAEIIIAVPSATPKQLRHIVERCEATGLPFRILPGIAEVLSGDVTLNRLREVRIEDLLGREPIQLELSELHEDQRGQSVLITGAAGSIGSELARQVALHKPARLVLVDQAETDLFYLELELRERYPKLDISAVMSDIVDESAVERVFAEYRPGRVYHAAAYKHVPMMEYNPREAIRNNVVGTLRVADAAGRHGTEKFVLVSTDKAARPANVMGASKRLAEQVILELQERYDRTTYTAVRFGNVLGSNGSVIPVFQRQIMAGKPLTVTHPEATRYFMTIPEAVQLILKASLLPELRGHIALLEMGEPVRIVDLAANLLRLTGAPKGNGQSMVFTGLRPGEKLHEELVAPDEETVPTPIRKVRLVRNGKPMPISVSDRLMDTAYSILDEDDAAALSWLGVFFPGLGSASEEPPVEIPRSASMSS